MATGELSNVETSRREVRQTLVDADYVDCIGQLSGAVVRQCGDPVRALLQAEASHCFRRREGEILFLDGRKLGLLIPGSRKQKQLAGEEVERIAAVYAGLLRKAIESVWVHVSGSDFSRVINRSGSLGSKWKSSRGGEVTGLRALRAAILCRVSSSLGFCTDFPSAALEATGVAIVASAAIRLAEFLFLRDRARRKSWSVLIET
jgi:hypothetical protein